MITSPVRHSTTTGVAVVATVADLILLWTGEGAGDLLRLTRDRTSIFIRTRRQGVTIESHRRTSESHIPILILTRIRIRIHITGSRTTGRRLPTHHIRTPFLRTVLGGEVPVEESPAVVAPAGEPAEDEGVTDRRRLITAWRPTTGVPVPVPVPVLVLETLGVGGGAAVGGKRGRRRCRCRCRSTDDVPQRNPNELNLGGGIVNESNLADAGIRTPSTAFGASAFVQY